MEKEDKEKILKEVKEELMELEWRSSMENDVEVSEAVPKKKKRLLGFGLDSDEEKANGAVKELRMYEKREKTQIWRGSLSMVEK